MVNKKEIETLLDTHFRVTGKVNITDQGVVHVKGGVYNRIILDHVPVQFGKVTGDCDLGNGQVASLINCPTHVGGSFHCDENRLTNLMGAPTHVGGSFTCNYNLLTSLEGAPTHVAGSFLCQNNQLSDLKGAPSHVGDSFVCNRNPLTSLEGVPAHVGNHVVVSYSHTLPLLRLLNYPKRVDYIYNVPTEIAVILEKYAGQGKPGMIKAAADMIRAGCNRNARW
jgi:hypothetical protein